MFGIVDENGLRIFREVFLVMGRKNGKSLFASACIAYMAYLDGEYGAKIYCLAPKLEQAAIVYDNFYKMIHQEPELDELAQKRRSDIYLEGTNTAIKPLAFNAKKSDGFNPHMTVCDEIASWPAEQGLKQYEVMKSALGARLQPMILSISTAGYVNDGPYDELMARATAVLLGSSKERRLLPILYMIDDVIFIVFFKGDASVGRIRETLSKSLVFREHARAARRRVKEKQRSPAKSAHVIFVGYGRA